MDPEEVWNALIGSLRDGDVSEANDRANDLARWLHRGGFRPDGLIAAIDRLSA